MTFDAYETSEYDGHKVELYEFVGTISSHLLTSYATDYVYNFQTYTAVEGLKSGNRKKTSAGGSQVGELEVEIPFDHALAIEYAFSDVPPDLSLTLRQGHASDPAAAFRVIWTGAVTTFSVEKRLAKLIVPSSFSLALQNTIPSRRWQGPCNHLLYDGQCTVSRLLHDLIVTVNSFSGVTIVTDVLGASWTGTEGFGGEVINNRTGERRTIQSHSGNSITVKLPFTDLITGDSITVYEGCDHSAATCQAKFNNLDNFGGFNLVPNLNPFQASRLR